MEVYKRVASSGRSARWPGLKRVGGFKTLGHHAMLDNQHHQPGRSYCRDVTCVILPRACQNGSAERWKRAEHVATRWV
jgi:hypothetical protein